MKDYFELTDDDFRHELWSTIQTLADELSAVGVNYASLRNALVPQNEKRELAVVFDWGLVGDNWYGYEIARRWIPALRASRVTCSVLTGDLLFLSPAELRGLLLPELREELPPGMHWARLCCVYVNNLSSESADALVAALRDAPGFVGSIDTTYSSPAKDYLAYTLSSTAIATPSRVILNHGADEPVIDNVNMAALPWDEFSWPIVSVQDIYFDHFLNYKIETRLSLGDDRDRGIGLNALAPAELALEDFEVAIDEKKFAYLHMAKLGSLRIGRLDALQRDELEAAIRERIGKNYVYRLRRIPEHGVHTFNIMLEFQKDDGSPARLTASFRLNPAEKRLELVTFY